MKIAYVSYVNKFDIFSMNDDGSGVTQLTSSPSEDTDPSWSPDGKFIAFASNRGKTYDIWIMESNGANPVQLTTADDANESRPAWSPDGKRLVFTNYYLDGSMIQSANVDGCVAPSAGVLSPTCGLS